MLFDYPVIDFFHNKNFQKPKTFTDLLITIILIYTSADEFENFLHIYIKTCKHLGNHVGKRQLFTKDHLLNFFLQNTKIVVLHEYIIYEKIFSLNLI